MNLIRRLFGKADGPEDSGALICPHCERAMEAEHKCAAMSRRFFFGITAGAVVAVPVAAVLKPAAVEVPRQLVAGVDLNAVLAGVVDRKRQYVYDSMCTTSCVTVSSDWLTKGSRGMAIGDYMPVHFQIPKKQRDGGIW